jgi:hypothetical protein
VPATWTLPEKYAAKPFALYPMTPAPLPLPLAPRMPAIPVSVVPMMPSPLGVLP